jgi:hypothetical protein
MRERLSEFWWRMVDRAMGYDLPPNARLADVLPGVEYEAPDPLTLDEALDSLLASGVDLWTIRLAPTLPDGRRLLSGDTEGGFTVALTFTPA